MNKWRICSIKLKKDKPLALTSLHKKLERMQIVEIKLMYNDVSRHGVGAKNLMAMCIPNENVSGMLTFC